MMAGDNGVTADAPEGLAGLLALNTLGVRPGMYQALKLRLDLFDETVFMTRYSNGHPSQVHEVSPLDLAAAFADVEIATPILPRRCLFWSRQGDKERLGVYLPPQSWGLWLAGRKRRACVPLPGLVLVGHGCSYRLWAVKHPGKEDGDKYAHAANWQPCETDRLYRAPLPNVNPHGQDAGVCQGSAARDFPGAAAGTIYEALDALFDSEWNAHWVQEKSQAEPRDVRKIYPRARRLGRWPDEDLVETRLVLGDVASGN